MTSTYLRIMAIVLAILAGAALVTIFHHNDPAAKETQAFATATIVAPVIDGEPYTKPTTVSLRSSLTPLQYQVTQEDGTEPAYANEYFDNHAAGIYVDRISGEALFSSKDKYDSGTGWPSFVRPLSEDSIVLKSDTQFGFERTEVRSRASDSHLGHVFDDGPADRGGKRYCMNSAALLFVPQDEMEAKGYGAYLSAL